MSNSCRVKMLSLSLRALITDAIGLYLTRFVVEPINISFSLALVIATVKRRLSFKISCSFDKKKIKSESLLLYIGYLILNLK